MVVHRLAVARQHVVARDQQAGPALAQVRQIEVGGWVGAAVVFKNNKRVELICDSLMCQFYVSTSPYLY